MGLFLTVFFSTIFVVLLGTLAVKSVVSGRKQIAQGKSERSLNEARRNSLAYCQLMQTTADTEIEVYRVIVSGSVISHIQDCPNEWGLHTTRSKTGRFIQTATMTPNEMRQKHSREKDAENRWDERVARQRQRDNVRINRAGEHLGRGVGPPEDGVIIS